MIKELLKDIKRTASKGHVPIISSEVEALISILIKLKRPGRILEIGTAVGFSALSMIAAALDECQIDTIEKDYDMALEARKNIEKAKLGDSVNLIFGDAREILPTLRSKYDMVFIDASKNQYRDYISDIMGLLEIDALIIADNVLFKGIIKDKTYNKRKNRTIKKSLLEFLDIIERDERLETTVLDIADGVSLSFFRGNIE